MRLATPNYPNEVKDNGGGRAIGGASGFSRGGLREAQETLVSVRTVFLERERGGTNIERSEGEWGGGPGEGERSAPRAEPCMADFSWTPIFDECIA